MRKACYICGKHAAMGKKIARRGLAKKKGGAGMYVTGVTSRVFRPNLQRVRTVINGTPKRILVCTKCIKAGKIQRK